MWNIWYFILTCAFLSNILVVIKGDAPVLEIAGGKIKGEDKESRDDRDYFAYRGIPYAKARRFEPPTKPDNWTGIRDAEEYGEKCIQYSTYEKKVTGAEECHFVNVFTPSLTGDGISKKLLPVLVFIHDGFMDGTSEIYRPHYFMDQDVVIVTFNYRQNAFGFLSTGDDVISGNMGLKDQVMALQWIRDNVRKFAGDPNRVTIFGAGDGASSVQLLMLSPLAKGLFHKAISSGSCALKLSVIQRRPKESSQRLARALNCKKILNENENATKTSDCFYDNSTLIAECLRLVDAKKLAEVQKDAFGFLNDQLSFFGPVVETPSTDIKDNNFLTEHPYSIISSGRQNSLPWLIGISSQGGLTATGVILNDKTLVDRLDGHWPELSPRLLKYDWTRSDITKKIKRFYLSDRNYEFVQSPSNNESVTPLPQIPIQTEENPLNNAQGQILPILPGILTSIPQIVENEQERSINFEEQFKSFTDLFTDRYYTFPMYESVKFQSKISPVYVYYNNYEGQFSLLDVYTGKSKEPAPAMKKVSNWFKKNILGRQVQTPKHMGVCSGDELILLFKYPDLKIKENTKDYQMSKDLVKLWVQFATDETKMVFNNSPWLPAIIDKEGKFNAMHFNNAPIESGFVEISEVLMRRMKFWTTLTHEYLAPFDQI